MEQDSRPTTPPSGGLSSRSSKQSLTLDLSNLPPLTQPTPPSNTLLLTNLLPDAFLPDNLQTIRSLVEQVAPIHAWAPLKSFRRILVSFFDDASAVAVRQVWDGEAVLGQPCRVYFGRPTPTDEVAARDRLLALPDAGKLFFISPPPSPPHGWEMRREDAPNKMVHAEDLAEALARLRHRGGEDDGAQQNQNFPVSPVDSTGRQGRRSRSSTIVFQPPAHGGSPDLPCVTVDDMTDEPEDVSMSPSGEARPILAHTTRPPVELMHDA